MRKRSVTQCTYVCTSGVCSRNFREIRAPFLPAIRRGKTSEQQNRNIARIRFERSADLGGHFMPSRDRRARARACNSHCNGGCKRDRCMHTAQVSRESRPIAATPVYVYGSNVRYIISAMEHTGARKERSRDNNKAHVRASCSTYLRASLYNYSLVTRYTVARTYVCAYMCRSLYKAHR